MLYKTSYESPIGKLILVSRNNELIGLWIENQKYYLENINEPITIKDNLPIFNQTKKWLDKYFNNKKPSPNELKLNPTGTSFYKLVWRLLCNIPYGKTMTYKEIANHIKKILHKEKMSAQAIGNAISHNHILIIIPCHRVISTNGNLSGYAGGINNKRKLLEHEGIIIKQKNKKNGEIIDYVEKQS